ncbi:hypothetical protein [Pedobacter sp.]|uniref:hypothetical protein n=1 Tax=Pedobacter sp. TaxID=1411316 RepID=UPI003D7FA7BF
MMKLRVFITDKENSHIKNDEGVDLFVRDIAIEDEDRRENNTLCVIDNWQIIFTENDEDSIVEAQMLVAENTIKQVTRYIECYQLLRLRSDIAINQLKFKEAENSDFLNLEKLRMNEVQKQLKEYDSEYRTIINNMSFQRLGMDDISPEWIVENMLNAELMCQDALLDGIVV